MASEGIPTEGVPAGASPAPPPAAGASPKRTMMGVLPSELSLGMPTAPAAASPAAGAMRPPKGTMIGLNANDLMPPSMGGSAQLVTPPPAPAPAAHAYAPPAAEARPAQRTMLGVALPGIAPLQPGVAAPPASVAASSISPSRQQTMLGVATPGIAPTHGSQPSYAEVQAPAQSNARPRGTQMGVGAPAPLPVVPIVPMPPPLVDDVYMPQAPVRAERRGLPIALVAGGGALVVLVIGVVVVLLARGGAPLSAQPRLDAQGKEVLHLRCESCPDGTTAKLNGTTSTFQSHEADLAMTTPLRVGDNPLSIAVDRPGMGRDETVSLAVPLAYRIRTDLSGITAPTPVMLVRVEAPAKTSVTIDGKPMAFDAAGAGVHTVDISAETTGASTEPKVIERVLPYVVTTPGSTPERGTVTARVGVVPLQLDAPGGHAVIDTPQVLVAGRTAKGAAVVVNGKPAPVTAEGSFELAVDVAIGAPLTVDVRSTAASFAPRTVRIAVKRVTSLEAEAKAFEATTKLGYDALMRDVAAATGQPIVVEGDVIEARPLGRQTVVLLNDRRGCAHGPCVTRVVLGRELSLERGALARAYGRVSRSVTAAGGKTVPEVEADFLLKGRAGRGT